MFKIGQGYDIHKLVEGRELIIGGVSIPHTKGLLGHSDADVLIHAIIDAILGACSASDIGTIFSDNDDKYKNANSRDLLKYVSQNILHNSGYKIANIDSTIILETPKLKDYIPFMKQNIAEDLGIEVDMVSIKAKTKEGCDAVGKFDAAESHAIILIYSSSLKFRLV